MINDLEHEQPKALITGFSSGIGFAYAQPVEESANSILSTKKFF